MLIGFSTVGCMLDGGSGVNSTTEELVLQILNEQERAGIPLNDPRHPIKKLEKWKHNEAIRGVAGSKKFRLVGAVVVAMKMIELGKDDGPEILVRFKICEKGSTDWVGWILGARAIDCAENGGLGFVPLAHAHSFSTLGILMKRTERPGGPKPDKCYPIRLSVLDSDDESTDGEVGATAECGGTKRTKDEDDSEGAKCSLLYEGDPITLDEHAGA